MMALLALAAAQAASPLPPGAVLLGPIGQQALPAEGCAAYLWNPTDRQMVAMGVAAPAKLRLAIDGKEQDYAKSTQAGLGAYGFGDTTVYRGGDVTATLDMTVVTRADITNGATVPEATITIERPGRDTVVVPVAGLIGCVAPPPA